MTGWWPTTNRFPSLKFDVGEVNSLLSRFFPAGFYYKTFMWPASFWMSYEKIIRHAAGLGKVGKDHNDPTDMKSAMRILKLLLLAVVPVD